MEIEYYPKQQNRIDRQTRGISITAGMLALGYGLWRRSWASLPLVLGGGFLVYQGITGYNLIGEGLGREKTGWLGKSVFEVERSVTINLPPDQIYAYWRNFENLPNFMRYVENVWATAEGRTHWVVKGPLGSKAEWDAEVTEDVPSQKISWQSLPGSEIYTEGSVVFANAPAGRGTEVHVRLVYRPPGGGAGVAVAKLFADDPEHLVLEDLRRFKQVMETGEIATTVGQSTGREPSPPVR